MIFRLACLQIRSHRLRAIFVAVAAVLTSILYMTVISISYCILDSTQLSRMLAGGSDFHASVFGHRLFGLGRDAALGNPERARGRGSISLRDA